MNDSEPRPKFQVGDIVKTTYGRAKWRVTATKPDYWHGQYLTVESIESGRQWGFAASTVRKVPGCNAGIEVAGRDYAARSEIHAFKTTHTAEHWAVMPVEEMP